MYASCFVDSFKFGVDGNNLLCRDDKVYSRCLVISLPAAVMEFSPSTRTHHPSPPTVPWSKPPIALSKLSLANLMLASSKLPGCNQTALTPARFASPRTFRVTGGGVKNVSAVRDGSDRAETEGMVSYDFDGRLIDGLEGLIGDTGNAC